MIAALPANAGVAATFESIRLRIRRLHALTVSFRFNDGFYYRVNDPSAGSPTETLLRLLLPLSVKVHSSFHAMTRNWTKHGPKYSPEHSIGRSDGRCVQRAGT